MKTIFKLAAVSLIAAMPVANAYSAHAKMKDQTVVKQCARNQCKWCGERGCKRGKDCQCKQGGGYQGKQCRGGWYVAGNLGVSHLYDDNAAGTSNSVDENGPGFDATLGYQFNRTWGGELGYTQFYNSRETSGSTVVARTSHFAVHANATARYPLAHRLSALGKLGLAYSYAQKIFEATGAAGSSGSVSPYLGLGLDYKLTRRADLLAQWSFVRGNNYTGSATLYSLGVQYAL